MVVLCVILKVLLNELKVGLLGDVTPFKLELMGLLVGRKCLEGGALKSVSLRGF